MRPSVSFIVPCLNEEKTLPEVLQKINRVRAEMSDRATEIIVADNGSADASASIAERSGARVVPCAERGYGAALRKGIENATGQIIVFADADNTYDFLESPRLIAELEKGCDLVIGSRLAGTIHKGAMPFLHRYVGTPVLNWIINALHARRGNRVQDCNSGFRCFRREKFLQWNVKSTGMEFASEMLVKALKSGARISHVPVSLRPDTGGRVPYLHTWRDGMRHLLQILLESPRFFNASGYVLLALSWLIMFVSYFFGPMRVAFASVFGLHTMMFALLGTLFGIDLWAIGLSLSARQTDRPRDYASLLNLSEDRLFWYAAGFGLVSLILLLSIVISWGLKGFRAISFEKETLILIAFGSNGLLIISGIIKAHLMKRF